jgi:D-3-phosphoglycerate dehydrogenase
MPHLLIAGKLHPAGLALLEGRDGFTYEYVEEVSEPSYAPLIGKADALVIRTQPLSSTTIAEASRLKIVSRHGVGYDSVDFETLNKRRIPLCVAGDVNSLSVAEHAIMLILASAKRLIRADRSVREGPWGWRNALEAGEISDKNLLIIGYGRSGRHLARMAQGFGMQMRAFDPFLVKQGWPDGPATPVASLADGLAWADVISVHVPKAGRPILGAEEFALMKPGVGIVNTARGGIVDETALAAGADRGAGRRRGSRRIRRRAARKGSSAPRVRPGSSHTPYRRPDPASGGTDGCVFRPERARLLCGVPRPRSHRQ